MAERIVDRVRMRLDEIRTRGVIPTIRTRVEEIVTQVKERVGAEKGSVLTKESGSSGVVGSRKKIIRGL